MGLASTNQLFPKQLELYGVSVDLMWENAVATAIAMESIASRGLEDPAHLRAHVTGRHHSRRLDTQAGDGSYPNIRVQMITEATTPTKSANSPAATACRVRRIATEPK